MNQGQIRALRRKLGFSQKEFAGRLGVSPVSVARWESGQRRCRGDIIARIKQLQLDLARPAPGTSTIVSLDATTLAALDPRECIEAFRDLLWCEARRIGLPVTKIDVCCREISDGGVDARVADVATDISEILHRGITSFQVKSGSAAKPWQKSWLSRELFGSKSSALSVRALAPAVAQCLREEGRYVLVCFGVDCTPEQVGICKEALREFFRKCGFAEARVDVWSQQHLIPLFSTFYSLCLQLSGRRDLEFQSYASWRLSAEMSRDLHLGEEQERFIVQIRGLLRDGQVRHVRVTGDPGLGKTRLVLEALSDRDLAPAVVYVSSSDDFQRSRLFNELLRPDAEYYVILVLDECPIRDCTSIWNALRNRSDSCRIISIDHDRHEPNDEWMQVLECPPLSVKQVTEIIESHAGTRFDSHRWAELCSGSPRVAHLVGENLQQSPDDMLKEPSTVQVWNRFIAGYHAVDTPEAQRKRLVLRHLALFYRFGFELPVAAEAQFIAQMIGNCDPSVTWGVFQSIVQELKKDRILQGRSTLFIAPKALHLYLWKEFWEKHGRIEDLTGLIGDLPGRLGAWFLEMFRYAHDSAVATRQAERLLGRDGPFSRSSILRSEQGCQFLNFFAEGVPGATLACIERTFGCWTHEELVGFHAGRQSVVWALQKIAVWSEFFSRAAKVLLKLAAAETAANSNNATGTFGALFSMMPGPAAPTCAAPSERLPVLKAALTSENAPERRVALKACRTALRVHDGGRLLGAEYQGIRPTPLLWSPEKWDAVFDGWRMVWTLLFTVSRNWIVEERSEVNAVLVESASELVPIPALSVLILDNLDVLADDAATDLKDVVSFATSMRRYYSERLSQEVVSRLEKLDARIAGTSFDSQVRRTVLLSSWDDYYTNRATVDTAFAKRISDLATEAVEHPARLTCVLSHLVSSNNNAVYKFAFDLGEADEKRGLFPALVEGYRTVPPESHSSLLIGGYLSAVFRQNPSEWECLYSCILEEPTFVRIAGAVLQCSGFTDKAVERLIARIDSGEIGHGALVALSYAPHELRGLADRTVQTIIDRLRIGGEIQTALEVVCTVYCQENDPKRLPQDLTARLLESAAPRERGRHSEYVWSVVAKQHIAQYPSDQSALFHALIDTVCAGRRFLDCHDHAYEVVQRIIQSDPAGCWSIVASRLERNDRESALMRLWLQPPPSIGSQNPAGPLGLFPCELVLKWVDCDPVNRAPRMARAAPKSLAADASGTLTRELLNRFGDSAEVRSSLAANFYSTGWSGSDSAHYRKQRDKARTWLQSETSVRVRDWIEEYIQSLNESIETAEITEERDPDYA
jgi:transcriptional regulator with XRE-family HTH domain